MHFLSRVAANDEGVCVDSLVCFISSLNGFFSVSADAVDLDSVRQTVTNISAIAYRKPLARHCIFWLYMITFNISDAP